jgi:hypothetical protein
VSDTAPLFVRVYTLKEQDGPRRLSKSSDPTAYNSTFDHSPDCYNASQNTTNIFTVPAASTNRRNDISDQAPVPATRTRAIFRTERSLAGEKQRTKYSVLDQERDGRPQAGGSRCLPSLLPDDHGPGDPGPARMSQPSTYLCQLSDNTPTDVAVQPDLSGLQAKLTDALDVANPSS